MPFRARTPISHQNTGKAPSAAQYENPSWSTSGNSYNHKLPGVPGVWFNQIKNENTFLYKSIFKSWRRKEILKIAEKKAATPSSYMKTSFDCCICPLPFSQSSTSNSRLRKTEAFTSLRAHQASWEAVPQLVFPDATPGSPVMPPFLVPKLPFDMFLSSNYQNSKAWKSHVTCNIII